MKYLTILFFLLFSSSAFSNPSYSLKVHKADGVMELFLGDELHRTYKVALGANPEGHKVQEGDERTPEGKYYISYKNENSRFKLSLKISYPNEQDRARARHLGVSPGGDIMIHGLPNNLKEKLPKWTWPMIHYYHSFYNWTDGCIAVNNFEIQGLFSVIEVGTPIEILP